MADARLQQLRRWDHADLEAQVRLLRERMRTGELTEEQVELAAQLGDKTSRRVLDKESESLGEVEASDIGDWLGQVVQAWGSEVGARACVAIGGALLAAWGEPKPIDPRISDALEVAEVLVCRRSSPGEIAAGKAALGLAAHARVRYSTGELTETLLQAEGIVEAVAGAILSCEEPERAGGECVGLARFACLPDESVHLAIQDELVPWALGLRDPVAERVAAREAGES